MKNILIKGGLEMLQHSASRNIALKMINSIIAKNGIDARVTYSIDHKWALSICADDAKMLKLTLEVSDEVVRDLLCWIQQEISQKGEISNAAVTIKLNDVLTNLFSTPLLKKK